MEVCQGRPSDRPSKALSSERLYGCPSGEGQTSVTPILWTQYSFFKLNMPSCPIYMSSPIIYSLLGLSCTQALLLLPCYSNLASYNQADVRWARAAPT